LSTVASTVATAAAAAAAHTAIAFPGQVQCRTGEEGWNALVLSHGRVLLWVEQGTQIPGMGEELARSSPAAQRVFDEVDAALDLKLSAVMFGGHQVRAFDDGNHGVTHQRGMCAETVDHDRVCAAGSDGKRASSVGSTAR
jgi:hypothetical protein